MIDLGRLATVRSRPELADLDTRSSAALVELMTGEDADVVAAVRAANGPIVAAVDLIVDRVARGGRMIYVGAGTAGRLAVLDAAELGPTYGAGPDSVLALLAGGPEAMTAAVEGAEDDRDAAQRDLAGVAPGPDDVVVGISASGRTPYALAALQAAREAGAATVGIANNPGTQLGALADVVIELLTGPEIVAGSTRMKAGTSQKLVLTTLSTAVMIRLGKVYRNLMVDVEVSNEKLHVRAVRIVSEATGAEHDEAETALAAADGRSKVAIVMLLAGVDAARAGELLARSGGRIREALALHAEVSAS
jgi:N-acetylmuramic acid 6-phosphate etherase